MKNNLSDLKIIFTVTSILMLMIVISSLAHPDPLMKFKEYQYRSVPVKDTSFEILSKKYPVLLSHLRQQAQSSVDNANDHTILAASDPVEKKKAKVYYWISYQHFGEEGPKVNASHHQLEWCTSTLQHRIHVNRASEMKELIPLKIKLFHF